MVLGAGLAGLAAGVALTRAGRSVLVLEGDATVGGLAKTIGRGAFRFDLGGHRIHTESERIGAFLEDLLGDELVTVARKSSILLGQRSLDYPLRPLNAIFGLGLATSARILLDYARAQVRGRRRPRPLISLEDWVVDRFGRAMFRLYFEEYSEKVWGIGCRQISMDWVEQRIQGLSLGQAIRQAVLRSRGRAPATLAEEFRYPRLGAGRIAERMREEIERASPVLTGARVERLEHRAFRVERVHARERGTPRSFAGRHVVATIPLTSLVGMLDPTPPAAVLEAASRLRYRDVVIVTVMLDRERATHQTWIYLPDRRIPFSRLHEPTNWSAHMAPPGKTLLVTEHFCFAGDPTWRARDEELVEVTIGHLARLGFVRQHEVIDGAVVRVPRAYPILDLGYRRHCALVRDYLSRFENLHLAGRTGTFAYLNMDHAIAAGLAAAARILGGGAGIDAGRVPAPALAGFDA